MNRVVFLVLRRMRAPLVVLIVAYAVSILGLVLIPGSDAAGEPWRMDFFHAFYFVSYMATTIGFGEIPAEFSGAQRMWTVASIYLSVTAWLYAIGKILALVQDPSFKLALGEYGFTHEVRKLHDPFYIVCGYGDTGTLLVQALNEKNIRSVVIDIDPERINLLRVEGLAIYVPALCGDASQSKVLVEAGLRNPQCQGVVALTNDDQANLKIAITTKLLNPDLMAVCRAETHDAQDNMASFGTDHIINPFDLFGDRLALALHSPGTYLLHEWLTGVPNTPLAMPLYPPHGKWVLCGYGRFGKAVKRGLDHERIRTTIIEADPRTAGCESLCVVGRGTEAETLEQADIRSAAGVVAGTDNDANNLSVIMTAHELNPKLFMVARQNQQDNADIFAAAGLDLVMQRSRIIARDIFGRLTTPTLPDFLQLSREQENEWANEMVSRLSAVTGEVVPSVWTIVMDQEQAPAINRLLLDGETVLLAELLRDPHEREELLPCVPLLLARGSERRLTPADSTVLRPGDHLLLAGHPVAMDRIHWVLQNINVLDYLRTGEHPSEGWVWRWLSQRKARKRQIA